MDFESYNSRIRVIDAQISEIKAKISKLEDQIMEAQAAANSADKLRREFEDFVARRKKSMEKPTKGINLKSFISFISKATSMLTGSDYWRARDQIDEMSRLANQKLKLYDEDLDYCKQELRRLNKQKETIMADYQAAMLALNEGGK